MSLKLKLTNTLTTKKPSKNPCYVILVDENKQIIANELLTDYQPTINNLITRSFFTGKANETVMHHSLNDNENNFLLIGIGDKHKLNGTLLQKLGKTIYTALSKQSKNAYILLGDILDDVQFGQFCLALLNNSYCYQTYKSQQADNPLLTNIHFVINAENQATLQSILTLQMAIFQGQSATRNLANEPPNVCFPAYFAEQAKKLAKAYPDLLQINILGEKEMAKLGMNCFLAVSQGSEQEGQLIILEYNGLTKVDKKSSKKGKKNKECELKNPIVLVGKGVTFDTGGISLKPALGMGEMKFDMGGAAAVFGTIKALCEARLPLQVVGALACAENMPSGKATRPGDIVTAMNGKTVEILNTDAEGRLVLADTLVYVQRYQPKTIIDMATLTGACVVALGHVRSGVYSNHEDVLFDLEQASEQAHDRIWHMPLDDDYQEQLNSNMADMQNIGGMPAGSVTAACFLSKFVDDYPWAHLDIAGTAWQTGKEPQATGRPVPLLIHYLQRQVDLQE